MASKTRGIRPFLPALLTSPSFLMMSVMSAIWEERMELLVVTSAMRQTPESTVSWDSPFGPVRFDFAKVLRKEDYDRTEGFRFSAGTSF